MRGAEKIEAEQANDLAAKSTLLLIQSLAKTINCTEPNALALILGACAAVMRHGPNRPEAAALLAELSRYVKQADADTIDCKVANASCAYTMTAIVPEGVMQ